MITRLGTRLRRAVCLLLVVITLLVIYQLSSSYHVMFDQKTLLFVGSSSDEVEVKPNDEEGGHDVEDTLGQPEKEKLPFGEKFPPFRRFPLMTEMPKKTAVTKPHRAGSKVKMDANSVKKLVSSSFILSLQRNADSEKRIMLSVVDSGFLEFALNFKELSIDRLNITNFLLICTDKRSHADLNLRGIPCCYYEHGSDGSEIASDFGTTEYYEKTNVKTAILMQALNLGYAVLMADVDVVLFKNPFPYFTCSECDIHFQMDRELYNSGFVYVRPTTAAQAFYDIAWNLYVKYHKAHDQAYVNMAARVLEQENRLPKIHSLSPKQFLCGVYYFEHGNRMFENEPRCDDCVMAHNNYLGSVASKIYRFRENLLWTVDSDAYYSDALRKYLTYENPGDFSRETREREVEALKNAFIVATVTNRTLILPTFRCCSCNSRIDCSHPMHKCSLLSVLNVKQFEAEFHNLYREHSFLKHSKVPSSVKTSLSPCLFINVSSHENQPNISADCRVLQPSSYADGATVDELKKWLLSYQNVSVLQFRSLYGAISSKQFETDKRFETLRTRMENAFKCAEYEQWDVDVLKF